MSQKEYTHPQILEISIDCAFHITAASNPKISLDGNDGSIQQGGNGDAGNEGRAKNDSQWTE